MKTGCNLQNATKVWKVVVEVYRVGLRKLLVPQLNLVVLTSDTEVSFYTCGSTIQQITLAGVTNCTQLVSQSGMTPIIFELYSFFHRDATA